MDNLPPSTWTKTLIYCITLIIWIILRLLKLYKFTIYTPFVFVSLLGIQSTLGFYHKLPWWLQPKDNIQEDDLVIASVAVFLVLNYCNFVTTLLLSPPVFLIPYYFQIVQRAKTESDPNTGDPYTDFNKNRFINVKLTNMGLSVFFLLCHTYLYNKDLIVKTIENNMVSRQQTQAKEYFKSSLDSILVLSVDQEKDKIEVVLSNSQAQTLLNRVLTDKLNYDLHFLLPVRQETFVTPESVMNLHDEREKEKCLSVKDILNRT